MSRRPGRPPLDDADKTVRMSFRVPTKRFDELCTRAKDARVNLSEFARMQLFGSRFRPAKIGGPRGRS